MVYFVLKICGLFTTGFFLLNVFDPSMCCSCFRLTLGKHMFNYTLDNPFKRENTPNIQKIETNNPYPQTVKNCEGF